jgi:hypothetical protein
MLASRKIWQPCQAHGYGMAWLVGEIWSKNSLLISNNKSELCKSQIKPQWIC